jgi:rubrerythrin
LINIPSDVLKLLKEQERFEVETAKRLRIFMEKINNKVIRLLLETMVLDSMKHASILRAMVDLIQGLELSKDDTLLLRNELSNHISEEEKMLRKIKDINTKIEDSKVKVIIDQITSEEERHHIGLRQLLPILDKVESVSEDDWWEYMNQWANFST